MIALPTNLAARSDTDAPAAADHPESRTDLSTPLQTTRSDALRQARRDRRHAHYDEVRALHAQGMGNRAIARHLDISRSTVTRFLTVEGIVFSQVEVAAIQDAIIERELDNTTTSHGWYTRLIYRPCLSEKAHTRMYGIDYTEDAIEDLRYVRKHEQNIIVDGIDAQLRHEPMVETRNRKRMRSNDKAEWELRIGD